MQADRALRQRFERDVRAEMQRQQLSLREVARRIARTDIVTVDVARRNLNRWFNVTTPSLASRRSVAVALGLPETALDYGDDEEDHQAMGLYHALRLEIRRAVREEVGA